MNKACTVANIFWSLNTIDPAIVDNSWRQIQMLTEKEYISQERQRRQIEFAKLQQNEIKDPTDMKEMEERAKRYE